MQIASARFPTVENGRLEGGMDRGLRQELRRIVLAGSVNTKIKTDDPT